jgi:hypothetical protein
LATGIHVTTVNNDRAGAAFAAVAADLGAGETQLIAQHLGQGVAVLHLDAVALAAQLGQAQEISGRSEDLDGFNLSH